MYLVASPACGMMNRSTHVILDDDDADESPTAKLDPYLNVMNSGWCFFDVIFRMVLRGRRAWIHAHPFWLVISRSTMR